MQFTQVQLALAAWKWGAACLLGQDDTALLPSGLHNKSLAFHPLPPCCRARQQDAPQRTAIPAAARDHTNSLQPGQRESAEAETSKVPQVRTCRQVFFILTAAQQSCRVKVLAGSRLQHTMSCAQPFLFSSCLLPCLMPTPAPSLQLGAESKGYQCLPTI